MSFYGILLVSIIFASAIQMGLMLSMYLQSATLNSMYYRLNSLSYATAESESFPINSSVSTGYGLITFPGSSIAHINSTWIIHYSGSSYIFAGR
jgi:hypothetical protein